MVWDTEEVMSRILDLSIVMGLLVGTCVPLLAQAKSSRMQPPTSQGTGAVTADEQSASSVDPRAEDDLQKGTALTSKGQFSEAIPHLLAARGRVANEYAASFNLALCYVGNHEFKNAIPILDGLLHQGHENADVENLLTQAYVGNDQPKEALASLQKAAAISPQNEKLYLYVADACTEHQDYALALKVVTIGLRNLPQSSWLHYERGMVLSQLDEFDRAKEDFVMVSRLAAGSEIGYVSAAQKDLFEGEVSDAVQAARAGISKDFKSPILLTILGVALLRLGASPGQPEFSEAQADLEKAVDESPNDPSIQIALGRLYLIGGRLTDATTHLEKARQMQPDRPTIYANLAKAYQRQGNLRAAQDALATLEKLNLARAEQIRSAPGDRKMSYGGGETENQQ